LGQLNSKATIPGDSEGQVLSRRERVGRVEEDTSKRALKVQHVIDFVGNEDLGCVCATEKVYLRLRIFIKGKRLIGGVGKEEVFSSTYIDLSVFFMGGLI